MLYINETTGKMQDQDYDGSAYRPATGLEILGTCCQTQRDQLAAEIWMNIHRMGINRDVFEVIGLGESLRNGATHIMSNGVASRPTTPCFETAVLLRSKKAYRAVCSSLDVGKLVYAGNTLEDAYEAHLQGRACEYGGTIFWKYICRLPDKSIVLYNHAVLPND